MKDKDNRISSSSIFKLPRFIDVILVIVEKDSSQMYVVENCRRIFKALLPMFKLILETQTQNLSK